MPRNSAFDCAFLRSAQREQARHGTQAALTLTPEDHDPQVRLVSPAAAWPAPSSASAEQLPSVHGGPPDSRRGACDRSEALGSQGGCLCVAVCLLIRPTLRQASVEGRKREGFSLSRDTGRLALTDRPNLARSSRVQQPEQVQQARSTARDPPAVGQLLSPAASLPCRPASPPHCPMGRRPAIIFRPSTPSTVQQRAAAAALPLPAARWQLAWTGHRCLPSTRWMARSPRKTSCHPSTQSMAPSARKISSPLSTPSTGRAQTRATAISSRKPPVMAKRH